MPNRVWVGHDPTINEPEGADVMLQEFEDGGFELATRPGKGQTHITWGPPIQVEDVTG